MECTFIGVGAAFDYRQTNTSVLVETAEKSMLMDCGFNAAHSFVRRARNPAELDLIWLSHFHGDHCFGLPFLVGYLFTAERTKELTICGPAGVKNKIPDLIAMAYPNLLDKIDFRITIEELEPDNNYCISGFNLSVCNVDHSQPAMCIRSEHDGRAVFYSGDGAMIPQCTELAWEADLGILEAYGLDYPVKGHSTVKECLEFASASKIRQVALVHMAPFMRTFRQSDIGDLLDKFKSVQALIPEEGQRVLPGRTSGAGNVTREE
ncbi:MBL fold metallo-hydrolase [Maridesulfovibrio sp. FT414]|uniref:MBL fold metallo-hydrolase n=1 Tax=Maridesulfovibrio sp. FT414 TaxID=2979469 RepID=UPI003D8059D8